MQKTFSTVTHSIFSGSTSNFRDPLRADLGECVFGNLADFVPNCIHPIFLILISHSLLWILFYLSAAIPNASANELQKPILCLYCALIIFAIILIDCITGMHARKVGGISKTIELLDHWLDSIQIPLYSSSMMLALNMNTSAENNTSIDFISIIGVHSCTLSYNLQLIMLYNLRIFPRIAGMEAQCLICLLYLLISVLFAFQMQHILYPIIIICSIACIIALLLYMYEFFPSFNQQMYIQFSIMLLLLIFITVLYVCGFCEKTEILLLSVVFSSRINGTLVLYTLAGIPYVMMNDFICIIIFLPSILLLDVLFLHDTQMDVYIKNMFPQWMMGNENVHLSVYCLSAILICVELYDVFKYEHKIRKES